jgi:hypothetical protein
MERGRGKRTEAGDVSERSIAHVIGVSLRKRVLYVFNDVVMQLNEQDLHALALFKAIFW